MGKTTGIAWADGTCNFWVGCKKVSPACGHCYMFTGQERWGRDPTVVTRTSDATFYAPLHWRDPMRIFTCSWSDFFIEEADEWRADAWDVIRRTPQHTWMILTKRPKNIADRLPADWGKDGWDHVQLGVSVESPWFVDRIEALYDIPAAVRFISAEPLLRPLDLSRHLAVIDSTIANYRRGPGVSPAAQPAIHWLIIGGESGNLTGRPGKVARRMDPAWARELIRQGREAGIAVFFKQTGTVLAHEWGLRDRKGETMSEWPEEFQLQEFPAGRLAATQSELGLC